MTYRNRIKKPKHYDDISHWIKEYNHRNNESLTKWAEVSVYKFPYSTHYKKDNIDPHTGNYIGYKDFLDCPIHLKKRHRQYNKKLINEGIREYEDDLKDEEEYQEYRELFDSDLEDFLDMMEEKEFEAKQEEELLRQMAEYDELDQAEMMNEYYEDY